MRDKLSRLPLRPLEPVDLPPLAFPGVNPTPDYPAAVPALFEDDERRKPLTELGLMGIGRYLLRELGETAVVSLARFVDLKLVREGELRTAIVAGGMRVLDSSKYTRWLPSRVDRWIAETAYDQIFSRLSGFLRYVLAKINDERSGEAAGQAPTPGE